MLNKDEFDYLGITRWHDLSYKGQGITIASEENILENIFNDVEALKYGKIQSDSYIHGTNVMDFIRQVAPEARKITGEMNGTIKNGKIKSEQFQFLIDNKPDLFTSSVYDAGGYEDCQIELYKKLSTNGCFLCCAAGNENVKGVTLKAKLNIFQSIGACRLINNNNNIIKANYSSVGEELDFMSFDNLETTWRKKHETGTSFASPLFTGMLALVQCFFLKKTGKKLNHEKLIEFVKDHCIDLEDEGHDSRTGFGLFILPEPTEIDISKYSEVKEMEIKLKINNNIAYVDGNEVILDTEPIIHNNRTLVPIRFIAETFGCEVEWDDKGREVIIKKG